ncbi:MAG: methyltransferase [candidate division Zixibacteria bacterium]|nr:class I SAM-dependent methyltransferase [Phycisphaerae bacterium]NIR67540.1 class I SAM-dependent methyltransferase [candidate division Zixibacteria bacterium]NIW49922.1 methyltransferase [Gammaproteobacteria bacterium]NIP54021.1 class I SAM-dependent methyltransferase [Phycisphaerae bacterium]NIS48802.1 class I SAM-dependent methyltransferase [candidate division Zixibacteria bacterium]
MPDANTKTTEDTAPGAALYSNFFLSIYDFIVLGFNNPFAWKCHNSKLLNFYNRHVSGNHLDVGVGSGYYPDKCEFPVSQPRVVLMDLNPNSLAFTANRIQRYKPTTYQVDILQPVSLDIPGFDSISLYYLLHCLPGTMKSKTAAFAHLKTLLNEGGVLFGSTILGQGRPFNFLGQMLMKGNNASGGFSNTQDNLADLEQGLGRHFSEYETEMVGHVAFFVGRK